MDERLPPACTFALSVLTERELDPDAVPEEAVEAAQQHLATCLRCANIAVPADNPSQRKKKKVRRVVEAGGSRLEPINSTSLHSLLEENPSLLLEPNEPVQQGTGGQIACEQCRKLLPEYAEALDSGQQIGMLYPEVQEHLLICDTGCMVWLDLFRQEAKATRKYRRRPVRDPFRAIWWSLTGFFRGGQITMSPMALSYGVLILLILFASMSTYAGLRWHEAIYHAPVPQPQLQATPDGIGLSDGLNIYDACNSNSYQLKHDASVAMQQNDAARAESLYTTAIEATQTDTTGCNGAEAAIYRENLQIRLSGRPYGIVVVSFDSGPGDANPLQGKGTDREILYAAYTQELVGAFIAQQQYNKHQMKVPGAPLLYLVLANTTGVEAGALQLANTIAELVKASDLQAFNLLASGEHPLLAVLGLGPSRLTQVVLPVMCRAGIPLLVPTATGLFILDLITQTSLYQNCAPGFAFIRFSPDDHAQSSLGAEYAYDTLGVRNAAIFYDPSNPSSKGSAQGFIERFSSYTNANIVARETVVASGLLDSNGRPQAAREDLLAGLDDALNKQTRPELIYVPLLTNDVITLAKEIARLPKKEQPILMIGGEFVQTGALQGFVQWARQQELSLPRIFVVVSSAARPPQDNNDWQKQFYATFCTSFATPGSFCSGAAALDQGALLFADGVKIITRAIGTMNNGGTFPSRAELVQRISKDEFHGVSCPIALLLSQNVLVTSTKVEPMILMVQENGTIQIAG